jgi:cobalamin biosynthetic protein CobC
MNALPNTLSPAGKRSTPKVEHGGDLAAVRRLFPDAPLPWIDLSTGINPVPYPLPPLSPDVWARLPSRADEEALIAAAARRYGVEDVASVVAAPGTQALIQVLPRLVARTRVAVVGPTYEEHEVCWRRQGHHVTVVDALDKAGDAEVVVLVNPDNPSGRLVPTEDLLPRSGLLVVDEAFVDLLAPEASLAGRLPPRTIVLRSFGKAYGLAGLRLGFAIADADLAEALRSELGPWSVGGPAIEIGRIALGDEAWLRSTARRLAADCARLDAALAAAGFIIVGGTPLFRLVEHPEASAIADRLARCGIHVRRFGASPTRLRFGVPQGSGQFGRLDTALRK